MSSARTKSKLKEDEKQEDGLVMPEPIQQDLLCWNTLCTLKHFKQNLVHVHGYNSIQRTRALLHQNEAKLRIAWDLLQARQKTTPTTLPRPMDMGEHYEELDLAFASAFRCRIPQWHVMSYGWSAPGPVQYITCDGEQIETANKKANAAARMDGALNERSWANLRPHYDYPSPTGRAKMDQKENNSLKMWKHRDSWPEVGVVGATGKVAGVVICGVIFVVGISIAGRDGRIETALDKHCKTVLLNILVLAQLALLERQLLVVPEGRSVRPLPKLAHNVPCTVASAGLASSLAETLVIPHPNSASKCCGERYSQLVGGTLPTGLHAGTPPQEPGPGVWDRTVSGEKKHRKERQHTFPGIWRRPHGTFHRGAPAGGGWLLTCFYGAI
ncbi:hypothetical protein DFH09DRAFT_1080627 [Mycena vulgaris]|nr:hypothetical protein DFH09DRAFT_1080627 [Mycena vulgaris]